MSKQILDFLSELQENNNREWFKDNKARFDILQKEFIDIVQVLINRISMFDKEVAGMQPKDCIFRIYRDIRFSPNKLPYKNHFGAYVALGGRKSERSGYYIHLEPGNSIFSGGLWQPEPALLKLLRKEIYNQIDEFVEILEKPSFKAVYGTLEGEKLKRMPAGYPSDFPHSEILLYKDFTVAASRPDKFFEKKNWIEDAIKCFEELFPFNQFLNYIVDEYQGRI